MIFNLAAFEEQERRNISDSKAIRKFGVIVNVYLDDANSVRLLFCNLFERGSNHPARAAPGRPEIHENRDI